MSGRDRVDGSKDASIEAALAEINDRLAGLFEEADAEVEGPVFLVIGHQRSGTTLVYQYLASRFILGYPSNLVARFWRAPIAGILLERSLGRHLPPRTSTFRSQLGTTESLVEPHEFSYFWNHWFPEPRRCIDPAGFTRAVAAMESALGAPMLFKNVFNSLRVSELAQLLPTAIFVVVRRDFLDVACSTLDSRRVRFGTDDAWFGVAPEERAELESLAPHEQIAAQIHHTEVALAKGLSALPPERHVEIAYPEFCMDPTGATGIVGRVLEERVEAIDLPRAFATRRTSAGHPDADALRAALEPYFTEAEIAAGSR